MNLFTFSLHVVPTHTTHTESWAISSRIISTEAPRGSLLTCLFDTLYTNECKSSQPRHTVLFSERWMLGIYSFQVSLNAIVVEYALTQSDGRSVETV